MSCLKAAWHAVSYRDKQVEFKKFFLIQNALA